MSDPNLYDADQPVEAGAADEAAATAETAEVEGDTEIEIVEGAAAQAQTLGLQRRIWLGLLRHRDTGFDTPWRSPSHRMYRWLAEPPRLIGDDAAHAYQYGAYSFTLNRMQSTTRASA